MKPDLLRSLTNRDSAVIWHPYTQHLNMQPILPIVKGEGAWLIDDQGRKYVDAISSWWTNIHGHSHPHIAKKIYEQALQLEHVLFAGCTHEPAVQLAEQLLPLLPGNFSRIFYSDNGSTAVEVALKMAIQAKKQTGSSSSKKLKILALNNAYHGDTFGAMSVSGRSVFTHAFEDYLFEVVSLDPVAPTTLLEQISGLDLTNFAAFIYEPLVQGAGGMIMYDAAALNDLICYLKQQDMVCIADEVMTGFGRTGQLFASNAIHHPPDIICLSKGLTGGSLPLAITACTDKIFEKFLSEDATKTFFHGHSYTANPLACAAALASLELLQQQDCIDNIEYICERNKEFVEKLRSHASAIQPRCTGTILAFEIQAGDKGYLNNIRHTIMKESLEQGVLLRPLGNTIYIMPPYCITPVQLEKVYVVLERILEVSRGFTT